MAAAAGNVTRAAGMAGKERRTLGRLLKKYGI
jgi:DNA-binding protein Fis